jgi:signal transduction histidine kinase
VPDAVRAWPRVSVGRRIGLVRLAGVVFAALEVGVFTDSFPPGYEAWAWAITAVFAVLALALFAAAPWERRHPVVGIAALATDTAVVAAYAAVFAFAYGSPVRWALIFVVVEAALRYGLAGGLVLPAVLLPFLVFVEWWRERQFAGPEFHVDRISFPFGVFLLTGVIIGWLVTRLRAEARRAQSRAEEAERLRDELGRRVDVYEAASRCARALGSSLELEASFDAFIGELRALVPFDRVAILLDGEDGARVIATAGAAATDYLPPGSSVPLAGSVLEPVVREGRTVHREDIADKRYPEEEGLFELGLRTRVLAPLQLGAKPIGAIALARREPGSFRPSEVELVTLLGRLVAAAVQNIRTYDAERTTVEELRRLSALRADFVSLVSHELRSPMAAVIGSARTLQTRWRQLRPEQREAFLAVIADETSRLAALIGDVLDTSRIDAGTFGYSFSDVDLAAVLREAVSAAEIGQDEVRLTAEIPSSLPRVRGDRERLRQLVDNLLSNALKYSDAGGEVSLAASSENGAVKVRVTDHGPGIAPEHQGVIFEKFGRAAGREVKPGTGLGLFISRSFAEAHGGSLEVDSRPGAGATFTLTLPGG